MSLDLTAVVSQIEGMVSRLKAGVKERQEHLQHAAIDPPADARPLQGLAVVAVAAVEVAVGRHRLEHRHECGHGPSTVGR